MSGEAIVTAIEAVPGQGHIISRALFSDYADRVIAILARRTAPFLRGGGGLGHGSMQALKAYRTRLGRESY